jgi:protocatechuate 3,4-dioxygenase beta subunit
VALGGSIVSGGKGNNFMYVEGRVLDTSGVPITDAVIEAWETDESGENNLFDIPSQLNFPE